MGCWPSRARWTAASGGCRGGSVHQPVSALHSPNTSSCCNEVVSLLSQRLSSPGDIYLSTLCTAEHLLDKAAAVQASRLIRTQTATTKSDGVRACLPGVKACSTTQYAQVF